MLASQGKVLSPGNEGSMAVIVYVFIFPNLALFVFICQFQGFLFGALLCTCLTPLSPCAP